MKILGSFHGSLGWQRILPYHEVIGAAAASATSSADVKAVCRAVERVPAPSAAGNDNRYETRGAWPRKVDAQICGDAGADQTARPTMVF